MTADAIVDRVRSLCVQAPFLLKEAAGSWESFDFQPTTSIDAAFRIEPPSSLGVIGGFDFVEDRTDTMQIWVARKIKGDYDATRRALLRDVHSLTAAVARDAYEDSGDYAIPDEGRGHAIDAEPGKEYAVLRLTLPLNYECSL